MAGCQSVTKLQVPQMAANFMTSLRLLTSQYQDDSLRTMGNNSRRLFGQCVPLPIFTKCRNLKYLPVRSIFQVINLLKCWQSSSLDNVMNRVPFEKQIVTYKIEKIIVFSKIRRIITVLTKANHCTLLCHLLPLPQTPFIFYIKQH